MQDEITTEQLPVENSATPRSPGSIRLRGAMIAIPLLVVLGIAFALMPSSRGHGTHKKLGLRSCGFLARNGYPCPSCGMTTSMAAMAHGQLGKAFQAQAFGPVLFLVMVLWATAGAGELVTGRPQVFRLKPSIWWFFVLAAGMLFGWGLKVLLGMEYGLYPMGR